MTYASAPFLTTIHTPLLALPFLIILYQVLRNFVVASKGVMIMISKHFVSQSDCINMIKVMRNIHRVHIVLF